MALIDQKNVGNILVIQVDADPTSGGGIVAPVGSLSLMDNGTSGVWQKTGAGNTAWTQLPVGFAAPASVGTANTTGTAVTTVHSDHVHQGLHSAKQNAGSAMFGDITFQNGTGMTITDNGSGVFTFTTTSIASDLLVTQGAGLNVTYNSGRVSINGTITDVSSGSLVLGASISNGWIYVTTAGVVTSGASLPDNSVPMAQFTTNVSTITALADKRASLNNNVIFGIVGSIQTVNATNAVSAGTGDRPARADHVHPLTTGAASTQTPDQANAAGSSAGVARQDHVHNIPSATPVALLVGGANARGVAATFALSDHTHALATATPVSVGSANAAGSATTHVFSDHVHQGMHSLKANSGGTQRFGDVVVQQGVGVSVVDAAGTFTVDTIGGPNELLVTYPGSGLSVNFTAGKVIQGSTVTTVSASSLALTASTSGFVYVDVDNVVKSTTGTVPQLAYVLASYVTSGAAVTTLLDKRVFLTPENWTLGVDLNLSTVNSATTLLNFVGTGATVTNQGAGRVDITVTGRNYIAVTNETTFLQAFTDLSTIGGGTIHITNTVTLTANRTLATSNVRIIADTSIQNAIVLNGFVITIQGSGVFFGNCRFTGAVTTTGTRSQAFLNVDAGTPPLFIWFDNCIFKNLIGDTAYNLASSPNGVICDLTGGTGAMNVIFENCNASSDWYTLNGSILSGLTVRNTFGSNKFVFVTGNIGQNEGRNRYTLVTQAGSPASGNRQAFITDGSGIHFGAFEVPGSGALNQYTSADAAFGRGKFNALTTGATLALEIDIASTTQLQEGLQTVNATAATQTFTLPATPCYADGATFHFLKSGPFDCVLNQSAPDTINGTTSYTVRGNNIRFDLIFSEAAGDWTVVEFARRDLYTVNTTTNTVTTLATFTVPTDSNALVRATVTARRTGGSAGAANDGATYIRTARYKNTAGTVTVSTVNTDFTSEDQAAWNATMDVSGTTGRVRVTGETNNNITWVAKLDIEVLD